MEGSELQEDRDYDYDFKTVNNMPVVQDSSYPLIIVASYNTNKSKHLLNFNRQATMKKISILKNVKLTKPTQLHQRTQHATSQQDLLLHCLPIATMHDRTLFTLFTYKTMDTFYTVYRRLQYFAGHSLHCLPPITIYDWRFLYP